MNLTNRLYTTLCASVTLLYGSSYVNYHQQLNDVLTFNRKPVKITQVINYDAKEVLEINCLADNIYFEARGESKAGQIAVGVVTLNRTKSKHYPSDVCDVVHQRTKGICQFSWVCKNLDPARRRYNTKIYKSIVELAYKIYNEDITSPISKKTMNFHAHYVQPKWSKRYKHAHRIGNHIFYEI